MRPGLFGGAPQRYDESVTVPPHSFENASKLTIPKLLTLTLLAVFWCVDVWLWLVGAWF